MGILLYIPFLLIIPVVIYIKRIIRGQSCKIIKDLSTKTIIITGGNTGIGFATADLLASMKATIIFACRSEEKTQPQINLLKKKHDNNNLHFIQLDLADLNSVREFVKKFKQKFKKLDILINNAAAVNIKHYTLTVQNYESLFQINYLSHFLLTELLMDYLVKSQEARIINVCSNSASFVNYKLNLDLKIINNKDRFAVKTSGIDIYSKTKKMLVLQALHLSKNLPQNVKIVCLHPGFAITENQLNTMYNEKGFIKILFYFWLLPFHFLAKTVYQAAQTAIQCTVCDFDTLQSGKFYSECQPDQDLFQQKREFDNAEQFYICTKSLLELDNNNKTNKNNNQQTSK